MSVIKTIERPCVGSIRNDGPDSIDAQIARIISLVGGRRLTRASAVAAEKVARLRLAEGSTMTEAGLDALLEATAAGGFALIEVARFRDILLKSQVPGGDLVEERSLVQEVLGLLAGRTLITVDEVVKFKDRLRRLDR
jgi:hypothetical protein